MAYNLTGVYEAGNPAALFTEVNTLTGNLFFLFFIVVIWLLMLALSRGKVDNVDGLLASSFVVTILTALLGWGGYVGWNVVVAPAIVLIGMVLIKLFWSEG